MAHVAFFAGFLLSPALAQVVRMSVKTQILELAENVPTKEGLTVHLEAAALVRLLPAEAVKMYRQVGIEYLSKVRLH